MSHLTAELDELAERLGIAREFWDWKGNHTLISEATVIAVLWAMGVEADTPEERRDALARLDEQHWRRVLPPCTVVEEGETVRIDVHVPAGSPVSLDVVLENGERRPATQVDNWTPDREVAGQLRGEASFEMTDLPLGYHRVEATSSEGTASAALVVTPGFVGFPPGMRNDRVWGYAVQLYSVTSKRSWGFGDLTDLADLITWAGNEQQAGFVLVNPLHAAQVTSPIEPSPYLPSSRRFLSPLYIRPETVPEYANLPQPMRRRIRKLRKSVRGNGKVIDRDTVWKGKREALWELFRAGRRPARQLSFDGFRRRGGSALRDFAVWSALSEIHGTDWRQWPEELRDPCSTAAEEFAAAQAERVEFFEWLQWTAQQQLSAAQTVAEEAGMGIGVLADLAVGVGKTSAETWLMGDVYAPGITVGAPPDQYNQGGQDWGQPPWNPLKLEELEYEPFRAMVRAALNRVGGLRIDHIIGLFRLWWVPEGLGPSAGTYVRYNHEALIGILALEAYRAQALVVGEDLGTVEPWVREYLSRRGLLGTAILWWEYGTDGQVLPPEKWREYCMASITTHDLPPTLGYLESGHVRLREQLGLLLEPVEQELAVAERERDMWVERLIAFGLLDEALAGDHVEVMLAMHRYLRLTNSKVLVASLADAAGEKRAQNQPGTMNEYPNWRVPLADSGGKSLKLEDLFTADLPRRVADVMNGDRQDS